MSRRVACLCPRAMFFAPFPLLFTWLVGLLSLALLGGGVYILFAWYVGWLVGTSYLVAGVAMTCWSLIGRWVVLLFHPAGRDEPHSLQADSEIRLPRPDGTSLYVERYGPTEAPTVVLTHGAGANRTSWYYLIGALGSVSVPTLVCTGHLDRLIVPETAAFMLEQMPRARLAPLQPAGHMSVVERHEALTSELALFFGEILGEDTVARGRARVAQRQRAFSNRAASN